MLNFYFILLAINAASLLALLLRMNLKHPQMFKEMELGNIAYGSISKMALLIEFIVKRSFNSLNDPFLSVSCIVFFVSFCAVFITLVVNLVRF